MKIHILIPSVRDFNYLGRLIASIKRLPNTIQVSITIHRNYSVPGAGGGSNQDPIYSELKSLTDNITIFWDEAEAGAGAKSSLGCVYKNLWDSVKDGEYVWFLEDDDYILNSIYLKCLGESVPWDNLDFIFIGYKSTFAFMDSTNWEHTLTGSQSLLSTNDIIEFLINREIETDAFQLSCVIFRKDSTVDFPLSDDLSNDWLLVKRALTTAGTKTHAPNIKIITEPIFMQTDDAKDNISIGTN